MAKETQGSESTKSLRKEFLENAAEIDNMKPFVSENRKAAIISSVKIWLWRSPEIIALLFAAFGIFKGVQGEKISSEIEEKAVTEYVVMAIREVESGKIDSICVPKKDLPKKKVLESVNKPREKWFHEKFGREVYVLDSVQVKDYELFKSLGGINWNLPASILLGICGTGLIVSVMRTDFRNGTKIRRLKEEREGYRDTLKEFQGKIKTIRRRQAVIARQSRGITRR